MRKLTQWLIMAIAAIVAMPSVAATFVGDRDDFRDETIYFAMTTRFYDGDPTNNVLSWSKPDVQKSKNDPDWRGDFAGLIQKLDYIKALGFTTVWITPVVQNCSGEDYHGYHAMDFSSVDLRYESRKDWGADKDVKFQDLIDAAHAKGMKIVLDIVLNHTGNFGEAKLCPLFKRSQNIKDQANVTASLIPNYDLLPSNYNELDGDAQYAARFPYMKNNKGKNLDTHNYWHHSGTSWNWDNPNRWWGQIAGDCVDLNTEHPTVSNYLVECYGKFIEMGVDGFRIDTTGHISRLTFNTAFIPQFNALAEQYKAKRNGGPFFMFGECCQRYQGSVTYRDQPVLSSYFYQWKSPQNLVDQWDWNPSTWDNFVILDGQNFVQGNMTLCNAEPSSQPTSNNSVMVNGAWHEPDYSQYSGFSTIDFPTHYGFNSAEYVVDLAKGGDKYYNDASYLVTYVDSHDYCPGPNDGTRFNAGTAQWAENLALMFTFRGIPCIYYGSEVEFKKGLPIDVGGDNNKTPRSQSGRAYFGNYLEGDVTASDFAVYTASGNVDKTLNADLAHHIRMLNKIRAAVPALRKGQYSFDGVSDNKLAFKRAYKDSYALVAINGGATFSNVPAGTYTDIVTGKTYQGGGTIKVDAPSNKGQLRVLVKNWNGGKVVDDGKFIYATSSVAHGGDVTFEDPGTTHYYTAEDAVGQPSVKFSPAGSSFKTETLTVTVSLSENATTGWYKVGEQSQVTLTPGRSDQFEIGRNMAYGETVTVAWSASDGTQTFTGTATYKKVDPNATITIYVTGKDGADISGTNLYAWTDAKPDILGAWPGKKLTDTQEIDGKTFYYATIDDADMVNVIFSKNNQTDDITGITEDTFFEYDGGSNASKIDVHVTKSPVVKFSPNGGNFVDKVTVTATVSNATSAWYKIGNGQQVNINGNSATFTLGDGMAIGESVTVTWSASSATETKTGSATFTKIEQQPQPEGITVYYDNSITNWSSVKIHHWSVDATTWPGVDMQKVAANIYMYTCPTGTIGVVFNNGSGDQTNDVDNPIDGHIYKGTGNKGVQDDGVYQSAIESVEASVEAAPVEYYNLQGVRVDNPTPGIYIQRQGNKVRKIRVN